jgi:cell division protein FtsL
MALTASQVRARPSTRAPSSLPRQRELKVLERHRGHPRATTRHLTIVVAVALAVGSLLAVTGAQAYLTQGQVRLTRLQDQLNAQLGQHRSLELGVAQLEQPGAVLSQAQKEGLVVPGSVTVLPQVNAGGRQGAGEAAGKSSGSSHATASAAGARAPASPGRARSRSR